MRILVLYSSEKMDGRASKFSRWKRNCEGDVICWDFSDDWEWYELPVIFLLD